MAMSPCLVPPEERAQAPEHDEQEEEREVLLVHSQLRRIQREDEESREQLLRLRLLETRPAGVLCERRVLRSLSPLRRAGDAAIPVGD